MNSSTLLLGIENDNSWTKKLIIVWGIACLEGGKVSIC